MSVVGIDFGCKNGLVAVAQKGGVDMVDNEASNRATPCVVSFGEKERLIGEHAATVFLRNLPNSIFDIKKLLGRRFDDPTMAAELARLTCRTAAGPDNTILMNVQKPGEPGRRMDLSPEQVTGMILAKLKAIAEHDKQIKVRDVVIACPGNWSEAQRRALLDAAEIAGLHVLRLINEHAAIALAYGIYKTDLPADTEPARKVMFLDMGYSNTTAAVVAFSKGKLTVLSSAYDSDLGGRDFDEAVANYLAEDIKKKFGVDPKQNARAWQRILVACEKQVKRVISAGTPRANLTIENIACDRDYSTVITREKFIELCTPLLDRCCAPVAKALADAGNLKAADLFAVEISGGGMRLPFVQDKMTAVLGRELGKTMNMEEIVARGCALMCAALSPSFRLREFKVEDVTPNQITVYWKTIAPNAMDDTANAVIIPRGSSIPVPKSITFTRSQPIQFVCKYAEPQGIPGAAADPLVGTYTINNIPATKSGEVPKLRVKARLNQHAVFAFEEADTMELVEETVEIEEVVPPTTPPPAATATTPAATHPPPTTTPTPTASPAPAAEPMEQIPIKTNDTAAAPQPVPVKTTTTTEGAQEAPAVPVTPPPVPVAVAPAEPVKRKRTEVRKSTIKKDVEFVIQTRGLSKQTLAKYVEEESKMQASDKLAMETAEAKNMLESFEYTMRDKLNGEVAKYASAEESEAMFKALSAARNWLEEEGDCQTKGVYVEKLTALHKLGNPILKRKTDADLRPQAIRELEAALQQWTAWTQTKEEKFAHIDETERAKITSKCKEISDWLAAQRAAQDAASTAKDPVLTVPALQAKKIELTVFCQPIQSRPKPPPPKVAEPPKEAPKDGAAPSPKPAKSPSPATADADKPVPPPIPESPKTEKMDVEQDK